MTGGRKQRNGAVHAAAPICPPGTDPVEFQIGMILGQLNRQLDAIDAEAAARRDLPPGWTGVEEAHPVHPPKVRLTLRLDGDVAAWWRSQGEGYQSRINAVLRLYMSAKKSGRI